MTSVVAKFDLNGLSVLVTGTGLGLAYAECLAERGAHVTLSDHNAANAEAERLRTLGWSAHTLCLDISDGDDVAVAFFASE